ncbi:MAG TPA: glycosyltransferase family 4 protein [Draconibacterium sp.]|nr:glycosyltransferase family 4 protein [Draconibacterium sp.]
MNILQVTNKVPFPARDGGAIACMNLTKGFSQLGHKVTVLAMSTAKHHIELHEIDASVREMATYKLVAVPARINRFAAFLNLLFSRKPYNAIRFIDTKFGNALANLLAENHFDIIQLEGLYVCPYIPLIRTKTNALIVYRSHNIEFEIWERTAQMARGLKKAYLNNLAKRIKRFEIKWINSYDLLVPITARDGAMLDGLGNKKDKHVSQTGIDLEQLFPDGTKINYPSLFHIGSLEWAPNQEGLVWFLVTCWPVIHKKYPDLIFHVAGRNAPQWLIDKINTDGVIYEGEVDDAYTFMNSKAIMIVPLSSGSGMRIKIIEGMALGKSIVSTAIGAEGIEIKSDENILIANSADEFIEAVSSLIEDKGYFEQLGKNASAYIRENFDNLATARKLVDFYKQYIR